MNQILKTYNNNNKLNKSFYKFQLFFSITFIIIIIGIVIYKYINNNMKEELSKNITGNYDIYKLYSNNSDNSFVDDNIFGIIEIPKINIKYTVFSKLDDNLLKISPCKFYGVSPKSNGNICIAGHNYNNNKFFSNLFLLDKNDEIFLYDNLKEKYTYKVYKSYEVDSSDMTPVTKYNKSLKQLTLITCNNLNKNRLIVKSIQK